MVRYVAMSQKSERVDQPYHADSRIKPDPMQCPGRFCFNGHPTRGCMNPFGSCSREHSFGGDTDWYEPCEPELCKAGLPWFYYIPSTKTLRRDFHEEYIRESEALWGEKHWLPLPVEAPDTQTSD